MDPLISVIVPVHNGQDYIEGCLDSIRQQTYRRLEIIVVNDGSTDDTLSICRQAAENMKPETDRAVKIITLQDEGVSSARNRALDAAQGAFIAFVDADDRILPDMIQELYDTLCSAGSDMAGCRFSIWSTEQDWDRLRKKPLREDGRPSYKTMVYDPETYRRQELLKGNSRCWSKLYRREAIGDLRFEEGLSIGEDMLFLLRLHGRLTRIAETDFTGYGYYRNPNGAMNRKFTKSAMDQIICWEKAREILPGEPQMDSFVLVAAMLTVGRLALLDGTERKKYRRETRVCREKIKQNLTLRSFGYLDRGYRCKVLLFLAAPALYLTLYHAWKS